MPNWCSNVLHLRHEDPAELERARQAFLQCSFFQEFVPCPMALKNTASVSYFGDPERQAEQNSVEEVNLLKYGYRNWYDWQTANWGTKWDVGDPGDHLEIDDGVLTICFDTAWSPPLAFYEHMQQQAFAIRAYYFEPGMSFCGSWDDGLENYIEIPESIEEAQAIIPSEIEDSFGIIDRMRKWLADPDVSDDQNTEE